MSPLASDNGKEVLLTVAEAAAYLRVSRATLWRWCQEGRVPAFKIGHEWRVVNPALQRLVAAAVPADGSGDDPVPTVSATSPAVGS